MTLAPFGGEPAGFSSFALGGGQFVDANHTIQPICAIPDDYRSGKLSADITIESLEKQREIL
jgi:hypothetical protein